MEPMLMELRTRGGEHVFLGGKGSCTNGEVLLKIQIKGARAEEKDLFMLWLTRHKRNI